ncbi:hypothetical protein Slin14017_G109640 [Septoria linicola]|nr:hypothetical protein Slin14017_G109640 [Septoria linicola]
MFSGLPYTINAGDPAPADAVKSSSAEFSKAVVGHAFHHTQFTAPDFKATLSFLNKRNIKASELDDLLKAAGSDASIATSRVVSSNVVTHKDVNSAECYETLEVLDESAPKARQYMSKSTWRRQQDGHWLMSEYSSAQSSSSASSETRPIDKSTSDLLGLSTPPETPKPKPIKDAIGETLKAMMAQFPAAINSRQFDITQPPWSYIAQEKFRATMPPMEHHKMTAQEMIKFLQAVTAHSPDARSTIMESSVVVREYIGWAEVWQNLEMRDTERSQGVVHNYIEKMIWERQENGSWLAIEYSNIQGLDRATLPR